ncbi:hypothetical protein T08_7974 [Trichinella sp. T8]|nr:hypothetical protein T08_7974 [Trichinella sp. T8]
MVNKFVFKSHRSWKTLHATIETAVIGHDQLFEACLLQ